jgi:uncharacterized protein
MAIPRRVLARGAFLVLIAAGPLAPRTVTAEPAPNRVPWQAWERDAFDKAQAERRMVLAVVSTSWCHWCHVMQRETYADPRVEREIRRSFVAIKADGDARPDLAERFRNYRWPATAFFTPAGEPVLALRGYRSADELLAILADVEERVRRGGPYPGFEAPSAPRAAPTEPDAAVLGALREALVKQLDGLYDVKHQGWGRGQKYPVAEPVLWGLRRARTHPSDKQPLRRAMDTLAATEALFDRVWGGVFQYSVGPGWDEPHYEKIMAVNAGALEAYASAFALSGNERWKRDAALVKAWFERFLSAPDGTFYTSQDAEVGGQEATAFHRLDDAGRRRVGIPRVDTHVYARENGQAIQAYVAFARAADDGAARARAVGAADRILAAHAAADGALARVAGDAGRRLFVLDQAEMGLALLALARETADPRWVAAAARLATARRARFEDPAGGFFDVSAEGEAGPFGARLKSLEGNAKAARFLLGVAVATEDVGHRKAALRAISAVSDAKFLDEHWRYVGGLLLAVEEALGKPAKVTLRGEPGDGRHLELARAARRAARRDPDLWLLGSAEPAEAPFAVLCRPDGTCSEPLTDPLALDLALGR